ncbi:cytochrome P450 [Helicobacter apodemus]|uniref:Cytochrome n=1 Tax=Helicobacter apodemus TaxID=135569 RepID=A0A2U8FF80_9HELI|nr:cytochrome P450 [Helicobacter apodemus]AWI34940.1 cytochrome [Helicobacter apodemus]
MNECPFFPKPHKNKATLWTTFFLKRRSWLDGLYEKSYTMKSGRVKMPGFDLYIANHPQDIRRIMVDEVRDFPKSDLLHELLSPLLGESIFTTNGELWERQRELLRPSFEQARITKVFGLMKEAVDEMMQKIYQYPNNSVIEIDEMMTFVTADVIFRTIMSKKLDSLKGKEVLEAFAIFQEESVHTAIWKMFCFPKWLCYLLGDKKRMRAGEVIRKALSDIIKPRYEEIQRGERGEYEDILSSLLEVVDKQSNQRFTFEEILDQVAMLFLAGHETSASALSWTLYILSIAPKEQEIVYKEICAIAKEEEFSLQHLRKMKYLTNVFKESLRLYPPVGFFARTAVKKTKIRNKLVKEGSGVVVAPWLIQRHSDYWKNPHEFDPTRFEEKQGIIKDTYIPFGMGERVCIGQGFAMQEAVLILANILRTYKIELRENFVPDIVGRLTIRSNNGMYIKFTKRK